MRESLRISFLSLVVGLWSAVLTAGTVAHPPLPPIRAGQGPDPALHLRPRPAPPASDTLPLTLSGYLRSEHDEEPLAYATVYAVGAERGVETDATGYFALPNLVPGTDVYRFSHLGCEPVTRAWNLTGDTAVTVYLHHHDNYTETVIVTAAENAGYSDTQDRTATETLGESLDRFTGVSTLRTGTAAAKPVHDGLFGNRLSIQNNGIAQSGQFWGSDHAPEIDPWVAAYVRVLGGVEALKYAGSTLSATVLIEPAPLRKEGETTGKAAYTFRSNGLGHVLNARLTNPGKTAYRLSATGKLFGDQHAPDYFLTNTGRREANVALQAARFHDDRWTSRAYYSLFTAQIGVLRGSHLGNTTDLTTAFSADKPFLTQDRFSYEIVNPRQVVQHHLLKAETEFRPNEDHRFYLRYGGQLNDREEYDVRRGQRSDRAALALRQWNHLLEAGYHRELGPDRHLDANVQFETTLNDNVPGTGILPLIPDYNGRRGSAYVAYHAEGERLRFHAGLRYDRQFYEAITISRDLPRRIERFEHNFSALGASLEGQLQLGAVSQAYVGVTLRERVPGINELYSAGLHQGVAGIEEGDQNLGVERGVKTTAGVRLAGEGVSLNVQGYLQPVQDYIFLQPDGIRLTIRGAFPVFTYQNADVLLYGTNVQTFWQLTPTLALKAALAVVRGNNRDADLPVVFLPGDNLRLGLTYFGEVWAKGWQFSLESLLVREQVNLDPTQDVVAPPSGYALLDARLERAWELADARECTLSLGATNLLNTSYRDYLDRQRYFADAPGRNVSLRVTYSW